MTNNQLILYNSLGKRIETFRASPKRTVTVFTCGPSIYQKAHIGNFRTFLFEDILVRYLEYSGYRVTRGMSFTDVEAKAIAEANKRKISVKRLTEDNIAEFLGEMQLLKIKTPDYLPKASECVAESVRIIKMLIEKGTAYWHRGNVYFDPLKFPGFGKLFGLDMTKWPRQKRRFHQDTYPGVQWNLGDFILWHGDEKGKSLFWDTEIGRGRPAWNIQDPAMIRPYFHESLNIYCGGIDNIYRHHDYTLAILESVTSYPLAQFWLHGQHLFVNGQKMSKSKGNVYYTDTLLSQGYTASEIRFFLIYGHYRSKLNFTPESMIKASAKLSEMKNIVCQIENREGGTQHGNFRYARQIEEVFVNAMNNDLQVKAAFDEVLGILLNWESTGRQPEKAAGILEALRKIDVVFQILF